MKTEWRVVADSCGYFIQRKGWLRIWFDAEPIAPQFGGCLSYRTQEEAEAEMRRLAGERNWRVVSMLTSGINGQDESISALKARAERSEAEAARLREERDGLLKRLAQTDPWCDVHAGTACIFCGRVDSAILNRFDMPPAQMHEPNCLWLEAQAALAPAADPGQET